MKGITLFVFLILMTTCNSRSQTNLMKNERFNYQLEIPSSWKALIEEVSTNVFPPEVPNDSSRAILTVNTAETKGRSIDECSDIYLGERYEEQFGEYSRINQGLTVINGQKTRWIEHTCRRMNDIHTFLVYLIYDEKRFFLITARARKNDFGKYRDDFGKVIKSFLVLR